MTTRDKRHGSMSPKLSSAIRLALSRKPTRDTFPAAIPSALMSLGMSLAPVAANAQDTVVSVSPTNASHTAAITTDVSANLSAVETGGLSAQTFVVQGDQTPHRREHDLRCRQHHRYIESRQRFQARRASQGNSHRRY